LAEPVDPRNRLTGSLRPRFLGTFRPYRPKAPSHPTQARPVLVDLPGGAFFGGSLLMQVTVRNEALERIVTDAVALGILEGTRRPSGAARGVDRASGGAVTACLQQGDFSGKKDQVMVLYPRGRARAKRIILVGLGREGELDLERVRQAAGRAVGKAR